MGVHIVFHLCHCIKGTVSWKLTPMFLYIIRKLCLQGLLFNNKIKFSLKGRLTIYIKRFKRLANICLLIIPFPLKKVGSMYIGLWSFYVHIVIVLLIEFLFEYLGWFCHVSFPDFLNFSMECCGRKRLRICFIRMK